MIEIPRVRINGLETLVIFIQGGMGIGVSLAPLASAVAQEGGIGTVSSAALRHIHYKKYGQWVSAREATKVEIALAKDKAKGGRVFINCMVAIVGDYEESILGALDGGVDGIISGGGLPLALPKIVNNYQLDHPDCSVALVPIVSSAESLEMIFRRWERTTGYHPDAVVLEGPLAAGHLGFSFSDISKEECRLENLFPPVKEFAKNHGDFPVIVAGGIFDNADIVRWAKMGADGVQMGSRFAATFESNASPKFKQAIIESKKSDIIVARNPGSPCGLPFMVIAPYSPGYRQAKEGLRQPHCSRGFVLRKDGFCPAQNEPGKKGSFFCICNGLLAAINPELNPMSDGVEPIYTLGAEGWRIDKLMSAKELMRELGVRK